jgi:hypothetical protein
MKLVQLSRWLIQFMVKLVVNSNSNALLAPISQFSV